MSPFDLSAPGAPAHAVLVHRIMNRLNGWDRLRTRLRLYPAIAAHFELPVLETCQPPFYIHYLAWRLGTWPTERNFVVLEKLLAQASDLPGWAGESHLFPSVDFGQYWSLLWQLQVANLFVAAEASPTWMGGAGPDLTTHPQGGAMYVECYTYQKRFGVKSFVDEVCQQIDPAVKVEHDLAIPLTLPTDTGTFLDTLFRPFLDDRLVADAKNEAATRWPVLLPVPAGVKNFRILVEGDDLHHYEPSLERGTSGDQELYLQVALREVLAAKRGKNALALHRPNLVAVNMLMSADYQISHSRQLQLGLTMPALELPDDIDSVALSACGVDTEQPRFEGAYTRDGGHPALHLLGLR